MFSFAKKAVLATALAATSLGTVTPAMAQGYYGYRHHSGDTAGAAIAGGIVGIALGALIASSGNHNHRHYADNSYRNGWEWRDGYYWDQQGHRYDRDGRPCDDYRNGYYERRGYGGYEGNRGYEGYREGHRGY